MRAQCREIKDFFVAQNLREIIFCLFRVSKIGSIENLKNANENMQNAKYD